MSEFGLRQQAFTAKRYLDGVRPDLKTVLMTLVEVDFTDSE